jgi:hypothetical protein
MMQSLNTPGYQTDILQETSAQTKIAVAARSEL